MGNLRLIAVFLLVAFVVVRSALPPSVDSPTAAAVAGLLSAVAESDSTEVWQLDSLRRRGLSVIRAKYPEGSFTPPEWFVKSMGELNEQTTIQDAREAFLEASKRLWPQQSGDDFEFGRRALEAPDEGVGGTCTDCNGTGRVGDGRVFVDCLACGGDGKIDDSDLKGGNTFEINEVSNQGKAGDQVSRGPVDVIAGGSCGSTRSRVAFPSLRRLFER
jgi:hypothetical protein